MIKKGKIKEHPCFSKQAHMKFARIHLPVAPLCNIGCRYCIRAINKVEDRPGVTSKIISPRQAIKTLTLAQDKYPLTVVGIAGPGDALANKETFETFALIDKKFPKLMKCLSTNGLALLDNVEYLKKIRLSTLTVTVNAVIPETAAKIYDFVILDKKVYKGIKAAKILIERQKEGIKAAIKAGITTKINSVLIPEVNMPEIVKLAKLYGKMGAYIMNIMPIIPIYRMASKRAPKCEEIKEIRKKSEKYIAQFRHCKQCRADAMGIPGLEKKDFSSPTEYFHF